VNVKKGVVTLTDLRIQLHNKTGQMICTSQTTGRIESYHESQQVAAELQPYWREFKDLHVACDLSEMTRRNIDSLQATALRRAGGIYFDPKGKRDELAACVKWSPAFLTSKTNRLSAPSACPIFMRRRRR
jgi:hypothetical protein